MTQSVLPGLIYEKIFLLVKIAYESTVSVFLHYGTGPPFRLHYCESFLQWTIVLCFCKAFLEVCLLWWWKCLHSRTCSLPLLFLPSSSSCKALACSCLSSKKNWSCLPQANRQLEYGLPLLVLALQMPMLQILFIANFWQTLRMRMELLVTERKSNWYLSFLKDWMFILNLIRQIFFP